MYDIADMELAMMFSRCARSERELKEIVRKARVFRVAFSALSMFAILCAHAASAWEG